MLFLAYRNYFIAIKADFGECYNNYIEKETVFTDRKQPTVLLRTYIVIDGLVALAFASLAVPRILSLTRRHAWKKQYRKWVDIARIFYWVHHFHSAHDRRHNK